MADRIITVTDPSVVTNDTLAGYNNYSDIDGQLGTTMTPTEATNGKTVALSDGVIHEVTTKPVGTTNGEFAAVVSNAVTVDLSGGGGTEFTMNVEAGEVNIISPNVYGNNLTTPAVYDDCNIWGDETFTGVLEWEFNIDDVASRGVCIGGDVTAGVRQWDQYFFGVLIAQNSDIIYYIDGVGGIQDTGSAATHNPDDKLYVKRDAVDEVTLWLNDTLIYTYPAAISGTMYFKGSCYNKTTGINTSILKEPLYN